MKSVGRIIYETRKSKNISQEELAIMAKIHLRTIQRIENDQNEPRGATITLICDVLQLDPNELTPQAKEKEISNMADSLVSVIFLFLFNVTLASIIVYLTVYDSANIYSRMVAFFPCLLLPYTIVHLTRDSSGLMRLIRFGAGFVGTIIFLLFQVNIAQAVSSGAVPFSVLGLCLLYYGDFLTIRK